MPDAKPSLENLAVLGICGFLVLTTSGCYSHRAYDWPPVAPSSPGWTTHNGQAVWKPTPSVPELAGDVFVALNTNGQAFLQFSKTLPFLTAQEDGAHWQIDIPGQKLTYSGGHRLPAHFAWLQIPALLRHQPPTAPWVFTGEASEWKIENPKTGETLSGFLAQP